MSEADLYEMRDPRIERVVVHMDVGEGDHEPVKAGDILEEITGQESARTISGRASQDFGVRHGESVGTKITLRGDAAVEFLETALPIADLSVSSLNETGNFGFGVEEHTEFPSQEYDSQIGIYELDVTVNLVRPGYRVEKRDKHSRQIPLSHRMVIEDAVVFIESTFDMEVEE